VSDERREVVVVGAGPAGSATAALLARRGVDVLLLDAACFPRDKVCGEGVSPEAWRLLELTGAADAVRRLRPQPLRGMHLVSPDGTSIRGSYPAGRSGFALRRRALDEALVDTARAAGAEVREGVRVVQPAQEGGAVVGVVCAPGDGRERVVRARAVVAADGRRSVIARGLGLLREHRRLRRFAVRGYWDGVAGLDAFGEMHVGSGGYCGIAPLAAGQANVTFVLDASEMARAAGDLDGFYRASLAGCWPRVAERLQEATLCEPPRAIGPLALVCRAVAVPGAVLVGDAAGFYDPFTGEGVTLALRSAELATEALLPALRSGRSTVGRLREYERARRRATRDKFRFNRLLQLAVRRPTLANAIARRLARRPELADRLVGIAGDFVPARTALGPGFLLRLLLA